MRAVLHPPTTRHCLLPLRKCRFACCFRDVWQPQWPQQQGIRYGIHQRRAQSESIPPANARPVRVRSSSLPSLVTLHVLVRKNNHAEAQVEMVCTAVSKTISKKGSCSQPRPSRLPRNSSQSSRAAHQVWCPTQPAAPMCVHLCVVGALLLSDTCQLIHSAPSSL